VDRSPLPDFPYPKNIDITTMTRYKTDYKFPIAFEPQVMDDVMAEWIAKQGLKQCHVAETEKYAHVTFFFNGGIEKQFEGEERDMIPSPKVPYYNEDPKMSAHGVADRMCERIDSDDYAFIMNNFAPPDMVGHTGVYDAAVQACMHTDQAIGQVYKKCKEKGYLLFVTSDHG
jgi:2,3-bisphosphoglycerate-independent phosphoglycerate mutase